MTFGAELLKSAVFKPACMKPEGLGQKMQEIDVQMTV